MRSGTGDAQQNCAVPSGLRRRVLSAVAALVVVASLSGCASSATAPPSPAAPPSARPAAVHYVGAKIVDDDASASLVIVPRDPNGGLVVFVHGWGQDRWSLVTRSEEAGVAHGLSDAGFTILTADARLKAWGNPASVRTYSTLIDRTKARYDLRDVFLMGESMGGLATMQLGRTRSDVRAVTAWFPVCDLRTMRQKGFQATIRRAWAGRSRAAVTPVAVGDRPLMVWASAEDTVVDAAANAGVCVAKAQRAGAQVTYFHTSGRHGDPSNYDSATVVEFFERHRSPGV